MRKKLILTVISVILIISIGITGIVFAITTEAPQPEEIVPDAVENTQELPEQPNVEHNTDFDKLYVYKHGILERPGLPILKTDNEYIKQVAQQKRLSFLDICYINDAPEEIIGMTSEEVFALGSRRRDYNNYAYAVMLGKDLAVCNYDLYVRELPKIIKEINRINIYVCCQDECTQPNNIQHESCQLGHKAIKVVEFGIMLLDKYVTPLMENGEYELAIKEMDTIYMYITMERRGLNYVPHYDLPDFDAITARLDAGERISEIFYLD